MPSFDLLAQRPLETTLPAHAAPAAAPAAAASPDVDPFAGLPDEAQRAQLVARGWTFEPTPQGCVLRRFAPGYPAKVHVVSALAAGESDFETFGEVLLHGQCCARTPATLVPRERLFERLLYLLETTELLNVFDDAQDF